MPQLPSLGGRPRPEPPEVWEFDDPRVPPIPAQDFSNLPKQQRGLHNRGFEYLRLSDLALISLTRLAFSLASDSAQARNSETKTYSRISARKVALLPPTGSGKFRVGHASPVSWRRHCSSSGKSRWPTGT